MALTLTLAPSVMWDQFYWVEVCLLWGGRSITLAQVLSAQGSATVGFEPDQGLLETAKAVLPAQCS